MDSAIAALLGALIGAGASVGAMIIQQRQQNRRDLLKLAAEIAREDWKNRYELVSKRGGNMPPLTPFVHYHLRQERPDQRRLGCEALWRTQPSESGSMYVLLA